MTVVWGCDTCGKILTFNATYPGFDPKHIITNCCKGPMRQLQPTPTRPGDEIRRAVLIARQKAAS